MHKLFFVASFACLDDHEAHDRYDQDETEKQHDQVFFVDSSETQDVVGPVGIAAEQSEPSSRCGLWVFVWM